MKRKNLTTAVIAGLAGIAGLSSISNAAKHINPDGTGQALVYPYYSVNETNFGDADSSQLNTLVSVVNTTETVKAVKVRFLEGKNSREVLDFNLYLSPFDVWVASIVPVVSSQIPGYVGDEGAKLTTSDTSCTVPDIVNVLPNGIEFRPYQFDGTAGTPSDAVANELIRVREGHFEIIEMGNLVGTHAAAATHSPGGAPPGCAFLNGEWNGGGWSATNGALNLTNPTGGLFGSATIINVAQAYAVSYKAEAIDGFWNGAGVHTNPGSVNPFIGSGDFRSVVFDSGAVVATDWPTSTEATSALFMRDQVFSEFVSDSSFGAETSLVITFPTKRSYVDAPTAIGPVPVVPFTNALTSRGACEEIGLRHWDREENTSGTNIDFSPRPVSGNPELCWEANVININYDANISNALYSNNAYNLTSNYNAGWLRIIFVNNQTSRGEPAPFPGGSPTNTGGHTYFGLPVTGFAVQKYVNSATRAAGGIVNNYGTIYSHSYNRNITSGT